MSGLEELDLGVGIKLGMGGQPAAPGGGNCTLTGGLQLSDLGIAKLAKLKNLKRLNISGARLTPEGLQVLQSLPLERLSVWASQSLDDAAADVLAGMPTLAHLDMSYTKIGDQGLQRLAKLPNLKALYLTETNVTPEAVAAFRKQHPDTFVSWAKRPAPRGAPLTGEKPVIEEPMTVRIAGLSLALILFVSMMSAPRPQRAERRSGSRRSSSRRCSRSSRPRSAAAVTRRQGVASATRLHFPEKDATPAQIQGVRAVAVEPRRSR